MMPRLHTLRSRLGRRARNGTVALLLGTLACAPETVEPTPDTDASRLYWDLTLDQHAITMSTEAPYNAVRVTATPRTFDGSPLADAPAVTYTTSDPTRVQVDADGTVRAVGASSGTRVIATLRIGNVRHADTAVVDVTTETAPAPLTGFSILNPAAPDSAIWGANRLEGQFSFLTFGPRLIQVYDDAGGPVAVRVHYASSDSTVASIDRFTGELNGWHPGTTTLVASATVYGAQWADTVPFTITMPAFQTVMFIWDPTVDTSSVFPRALTIAAGGVITFFDYSRLQTEVVFDDPTNVAEDQLFCFCGSGNIPLYGGDTLELFNDLRTRSFPVPGTYRFHATMRPNMDGTITVVPPPAASLGAATATRLPPAPTRTGLPMTQRARTAAPLLPFHPFAQPSGTHIPR